MYLVNSSSKFRLNWKGLEVMIFVMELLEHEFGKSRRFSEMQILKSINTDQQAHVFEDT